MNRSYPHYSFQNSPQYRQPSERHWEDDRLSSINRTLDSLEHRLGSLGPSPTYQNMAAPTPTSHLDATLNRLNQQVDRHLGARRAQHNPAPSAGHHPFEQAAAEIARRKVNLSAGTAMPEPRYQAAPNGVGALEGSMTTQFSNLMQKLDLLKGEMGDLRSMVTAQAPVENTQSEELDKIASGIRALQQAPQFDPQAFEVLSNELEQVRMGLGKSVQQESWESGYTDIAHRLDRLSSDDSSEKLSSLGSQMNELRSAIEQMSGHLSTNSNPADDYSGHFAALQTSIEQLNGSAQVDTAENAGHDAYGSQLESIHASIEALGQNNSADTAPAAIDRMENRLLGLAEVVELMAKNNASQPETTAPELELGSIESRLDEITRAIVAVSRPNNNIDLSALDRLESRMGDLASMVEVLAAAPTATENDAGVSLLAERIEGLNNRLGSFEQSAADSGSDMVFGASPAADMSGVEAQLTMLAARLDEAVSDTSTSGQISNLESQISLIANKLGEPQTAAVDFAPIEDRLGQIENRLNTDHDTSLEAIQRAAQSAVELMNRQATPDPVLAALAQDLKDLQLAASSNEERTSDTFLSVQETLQNVAARLHGIEANITGSKFVPDPTEDQNSASVQSVEAVANAIGAATEVAGIQSASNSGEFQTSASLEDLIEAPIEKSEDQERITVDAPPMDPTDYLDENSVTPVEMSMSEEDNRPLEPGADAPDIADLVKRASEKLSETQDAMTGDPDNSGKTDFVAAARRAAQAAATDVGSVTSEKSEKSDKKGKSKNKSKRQFDLKRKPLVIAAGAVLLAIIALAGTRFLGNGSPEQIAELPVQTIERIEADPAMVAASDIDPAMEKPAKNAVRVVGSGMMSKPDGTETMMVKSDTTSADSPMMATDGSMPTQLVAPQSGKMLKPDTMKPPVAAMVDDKMSAPNMASTAVATMTKVAPPPSSVEPKALRDAASDGDHKAQFEIGLRYTEARGVKRDLKEAAKWYQYSAAQGFAPGQYRLGSLFEKGVGVDRDITKAAMWYERAAEQGNARAMHNLAVISAMGNEGKTDMATATKWFHEAANLGVKDSQFNLGILYGQGMGLPQNLTNSYKWFALAAKTGDSDAAKKRDEVANAMDPSELDKARVLVTQWRPQKLIQEANRVVLPEEWSRNPATRSASAKSTSRNALPQKAMVQKVQAMLNSQGYNVGTPDGLAGPKTRRAILEFQKKSGMPATGKVETSLLNKLQEQSI